MARFIALIDRHAPTRRPADAAIGYHRWSNLLFVHWRMPAESVQPLLPAGLTLDTWEGDALIGLVPFQMSGVRPWWAPAVPGISAFCETNVRTYVHHRGRNPGVWFFSLEAASSVAVRIARWKWNLAYHRATMELVRQGASIRYSSRRLWPGTRGAGCAIDATIGPAWNDGNGANHSPSSHSALLGTLEHFLIERYVLYTQDAAGQLRMGRVHHTPYPLRQVRIDRLDESLTAALGFQPTGDICHAAFSEGVHVDIFPLRAVE